MDKQLLGIENFNGSQDPFANESVAVEISNAGASATDPKRVAMNKAWYTDATKMKDADGNAVDKFLADGTLDATSGKELIVTGKNCSADDACAMLSETPCRVVGLKIAASNVAQLDEPIHIVQYKPQGRVTVAKIIPSSYKDESNNNDKLVSIDLSGLGIVLGKDCAMIVKIGAGYKETITVYYKDRASFRKMIENNTK